MGVLQEKIKQDLMQNVFNDTTKIYEFIQSRFDLDQKSQKEVIDALNGLNSELSKILKDVRLS